jgi:hypothetical protein
MDEMHDLVSGHVEKYNLISCARDLLAVPLLVYDVQFSSKNTGKNDRHETKHNLYANPNESNKKRALALVLESRKGPPGWGRSYEWGSRLDARDRRWLGEDIY